jgi:RNA polymerase sigma-70 factor, ECF subfamily
MKYSTLCTQRVCRRISWNFACLTVGMENALPQPEVLSSVEVPTAEIQALRRALAGDASGFEYLYAQHQRLIHALCARMLGDSDLVEDAVQETFMQAFRHIDTFRGDAQFSTWLYRIAKNTVLMHLRRGKSRMAEVPFDEDPADEQDSGRTPTNAASTNPAANTIDRMSLERAIAALADGYKTMVILHDVEGFEHREIAAILGCSVGNTKSQLHKARLKLRRHLTGRT